MTEYKFIRVEKEVHEQLEKEKKQVKFESYNDVIKRLIKSDKIREEMGVAAKTMVDGLGIQRIIDIIGKTI